MSFGYASTAYKPQIRQEGFHLSQNGPPSPSSQTNGFDPSSMFMLPDAFRKFHEPSHGHSMDFTDDLAAMLVGNQPAVQQQQQHHQHQHQQQHQQHGHHGHQPSQHEQHRSGSSYDDGYRPHTHNIFDISGPPSHHLAASAASSSSIPANNNYAAFSLPAARPPHDLGLISPPSSLHNAGPLHEFSTHTHFNSTLPALGSSARFDPHPPLPHGAGGMHDGGRPSSSGGAAFALPASDFSGVRQQHTPSPVMTATSSMPSASRSRSRSRAPSAGPGPGPTRTTSTTRAKRNSISSTSPPPRPVPASIIIPGALHRQNSFSSAAAQAGAGSSAPAVGSPLAQQLGAGAGWFVPTPTHSAHAEFSLPTPDSISSHFGLGGRDASLGPGMSPKDRRGDSPSSVGGITDAAAKQAAIANEKRRRRRESHNAVERRRRDNINEKIGELATLIPECMLDPNAPASFSPSDDQIFGATLSISSGIPQPAHTKIEDGADPSPTPTPASAAAAGEPSKTPTNGDALSNLSDSAAGKANKGMILRKSVDYIRFLQQLVGAQASRNRELESQLAGFRGRDGTAAGDGADGALVLHDDVDVAGFMGGMDGLALAGADFAFSAGFVGYAGGGALASVRETPMDVEDGGAGDDDADGERPGTAMTGLSCTMSPSVAGSGTPGSLEDDDEDEVALVGGAEEERGRRGRDGRVGGAGEVRVKKEGDE